MYILFNYYAPYGGIYIIRVDFCNIKIISLYTLYDLIILPDIDTPRTNIELDGLYSTKDHIVFIVES